MAAGGIVSQGITVKFAADTSSLTSGVSEAQGILGGFSGIAAASLLAVGSAAVAGGVAAVKMAGDFQAGMTTLVTGAGEAHSNMQMVSDGILKMAVDTGTTTKQLTDGMYMIESAGFHGAEGLNVLKAAAEGAKVGNADLASVANGVTTALTDYAMPASKATAVTNDLIATVAAGKTTMQALSSAMSTILPTASSVGVGLTDVSAAMATLTGEGTNAAVAATYLKQLLMALEDPASKGAAALKSIGLSTKEVSDEMKVSLPGTLQLITDHLKKKFPEGSAAYVAALADISGGSKQMGAMLQLTGSHLSVFKGNVDSIAGAVKKGGDSISGWADVQNNFNFKMAQAKEIIETLGIAIGTKLLPIVTAVAGAFVTAMQGIGSSVADTGRDIGEVFAYIGNLIKHLDLTDFNDAWQSVISSVRNLGLVFNAFMTSASPLRALLETLGTDFDTITPVIRSLAHDGIQVLTAILWQVYVAISAVSSAFTGSDQPISAIGAAFKQVGAILSGSFKADLEWLGATFKQIGGWIQSSLLPALATLIPPFMSIASTIITNFLPAFAQIYASGKQLVESMLTPLIGILESIIPPVIQLAGLLLTGLAVGFRIIGPLVQGLVNVLAVLIDFFTKTEIGAALVKATLILLAVPVSLLTVYFTALAIEAIAAFIMSVPAMVTGFLAGAAAAWTMASGVIAATWPFLAIIAVIALVILAIQHWGDIVDFLKMVWGSIADFFVNLWNGIVDYSKQAGSAISSKWSEVWSSTSEHSKQAGTSISSWWSGVVQNTKSGGATFASWWSGVWAGMVSALTAAWKSIVSAVNMAGQALRDVVAALINDLIGRFKWLYAHNYYFHQLVDNIVDTFKACLAWVQMAWTASTNWLVNTWTTIAKFATDLWNKVSGAIIGAVKVSWDWLVSAWNTVSTWLVGVWTTIAKFATDLWNKISSAIMGAVKAVSDWLVSAWNTVSTWLVGAWTAIAKFATDLWNKISTAVHDGWVKAVDFVSSVWSQIAAFFNNAWNNYIVKPLTALWANVSNIFSSAWNSYVSAPLSSLWNSISTWFVNLGNHSLQSGKNFIQMLVDGINSGVGSIYNAVVNIANTIWKALGFHSPTKEGPASDADKWMPNMISMFSDGINSGVGKIKSASSNLASNIRSTLGTLGPNAQAWSRDMMDQFVQGILNGIGAVGNAVSQVANKISSLLHHSKPDTGPLANDDTWMPDFMNTLTAGITNNIGKVREAVTNLVSGIASNLSQTGSAARNSGTNFINMLVSGINSGVGSIWDAVKNIANTIWKALGFHSPTKEGPGSDADKWMPNMVSMLSDGINSGASKIKNASSNLASNIHDTLSKLGPNAQVWSRDMINQFVQGILNGVGAVGNAVNQIANKISSLLHHSKPDTGPLSDDDTWMPDFGNMISTGLLADVDKIKSAANNLASSIKDSLGTLGADAHGWSVDMINQFVQGILKGVGAVGNAASKIASAISANLHFSKPDVGPLADADKWMPDFGNLLSKGLIANISKIQNATKALAAPISVALNPSALNAQLNYASLAGSKAMQAASSAQPIVVQVQPGAIYLDGHEVTNRLAPYIANMIRLKGDVRSR